MVTTKKIARNLARKYEHQFAGHAFDIETIAVQKDQDYENETTWWIFEDGSALGLKSPNIVCLRDNYGLSVDNEKLRSV